MSITDGAAPGRPSMRLDGRLPEGNVILCTGHGDEHSFLVGRLGLSIECPKCGQIALSADMVADFYKRSDDAFNAQVTAAPTNVTPPD